MRVETALEKYKEKEMAYAETVARRIKLDADTELRFAKKYLQYREDGRTENEAKQMAKAYLEDAYRELAALKAEEVIAEAKRKVAARQLEVAKLLHGGGA